MRVADVPDFRVGTKVNVTKLRLVTVAERIPIIDQAEIEERYSFALPQIPKLILRKLDGVLVSPEVRVLWSSIHFCFSNSGSIGLHLFRGCLILSSQFIKSSAEKFNQFFLTSSIKAREGHSRIPSNRWRSSNVLYGFIRINFFVGSGEFCKFGNLRYQIWPLVDFKGFLRGFESGIGGTRRALSSIGGDYGLVGGSLSLLPLEASIVGVLNKEKQCQSGQDESSPLKWREGKYLELCSFFLFVVGLWFVYTAFRIERITVVSISKILFGVIILVLGWATEQAALNLMDFGHIDWSHLL